MDGTPIIKSRCQPTSRSKRSSLPPKARPGDRLASSHKPVAIQFLECVADLHVLPSKHPAGLHELSDPGGLLQDRGTAAERQTRDELQYLWPHTVNTATEQAVLAISLT